MVVLYPGTFDPITNGHLDIISRALSIFDELYIAVSANTNNKTTKFSHEERFDLVKMAVLKNIESKMLKKCKIVQFSGLLVDFMSEINVKTILRGIRAAPDFEYEFQMSFANKKLKPGIETIFIPTGEGMHFISSTMVKMIASIGGDISPFVPDNVNQAIKNLSNK
jgi:pantetheine-phosphate adenylyltransferase